MIKHIALLAVAAILFSGCASSGSYKSSDSTAYKSLDVATALKFEDVPVPTGFKIIGQQSFTFENDALRVGILKFSGRINPDQTVTFYKDQMPLYNWHFVNIVEYGKRIMSFERDDQNCTILIEPSGMSTLLTISVAPKAGRAATYKPIKKE
ncbi:MAG: hypothetical protein PHV77_02430 [Candidatus Omnitrophica bacterium]|jgi:hypothetical protein|nr:hypothetical protein [Candidatus Omnitrophota bacterium]